MQFKKIRLWTMTESGNLSVKITRHPGQRSFEWCKPGWRIFSSSGSHACHSDLSFIMVSCCLNFFLPRCHKGDCVHNLKYITTSIHKAMWKIHLFPSLKIIVNCFNSSHEPFVSCYYFYYVLLPHSDPHSDSNPAPPITERLNCVQMYSDLITCTGLKSLLIC